MDNQVHKFVVNNQDHPQIIEICAELKRLSGLNVCDMGCVQYTKFLCCIMWKKKKGCFICVTIVRNWLLQWAHQHSSWYSSLNNKRSVGL